MKGTYLGEFEEIILLAIAALQDDAYGVAIKKALEKDTSRTISIGAVHAACNRLQDKGYLKAYLGEKSEKRGGKRKKCYRVAVSGERALWASRELRERLWRKIPRSAFQIKSI